jgi:hypothetical protein
MSHASLVFNLGNGQVLQVINLGGSLVFNL